MTRWLVLLALCWVSVARADTKRLAIIVGNNTGSADEVPLHYAETDADKLAGVLGELGGITPDDMFVLRGKRLAALDDSFAQAKRRISVFHQDPNTRVILVFYFSGHSDGEALELGTDRLPYGELRRLLSSTGADVRVALVDSCKSGALLAVKGGTRGAPFQIRLTDELASSGEALLTSSAADEVSLESREIGGSFFTHHFVSGLRGAADISSDGIITLSEAYQYAYTHTIVTTGATVIGPQHPAYNYQLTGEGELVLTELARPSAAIGLPKGFDRILVSETAREQVIAELTSDTRRKIAIRPGRYAIRAWRGGKVLGGKITVAANETREVRWEELSEAAGVATQSKGDGTHAGSTIRVGGGVTTGTASALGAVPAVRAELRLPSGIAIIADVSSTRHANFRETSSALLVGYRRGSSRARFGTWIGADAGAGLVAQSIDASPTAYSAAAILAPCAGVTARITRDVAIGIDASLAIMLLRRDHAMAVVTLPALWAMVSYDF